MSLCLCVEWSSWGGILCLVAMERVRGGVVIISSVTLYDNFFLSDSLLILNLNYSL